MEWKKPIKYVCLVNSKMANYKQYGMNTFWSHSKEMQRTTEKGPGNERSDYSSYIVYFVFTP